MTNGRHSPPISLDLPPELVDDIITRALANLGGRSLSSMALVSQHFRVQVNQQRFSAIILDTDLGYDCTYISHRLNTLALIVDAERYIPGMLNVASFITCFEFSMVAKQDESRPRIDIAMAILCKALFRPTQSYKSRAEDFQFRLEPWQRSYTDELTEWNSLSPDFTASFADLCRNSALTRLRIFNIRHVPMGLLQGSSVKHLHLRDVDIHRHLDLSSETHRPCFLHSLVVDGSLPFETISHILCGRHAPPPALFSRLKELKMMLRGHGDVDTTNQILSKATSLDTLTLSLPVVLRGELINQNCGFFTARII